MSTDEPSRWAALAKLVVTVVAAGVLVSGLLLPWVCGTGMVARNSASLLGALPSELLDQPPNGNTRVLAGDGQLITHFYGTNRSPVAGEQIADVMKRALVDIEDSRFYEHNGLDVQGTLRAIATNVAAGEVAQGGSTITQQLVKQTLLQTAATPLEAAAAQEQSLGRKLREARLALAVEQEYSKDDILTRYLNVVYFGAGAYGVQAAAQRYFSVDAADLTLPQASVLAGLVQSPANDDPLAHPDAAATRRNQVLERMHALGHVTDQELAEISAGPVVTVESPPPPNGCAAATVGGFFCSYLQTYLTGTLGISQSQLDGGGLTVQTTLRPDIQLAGDRAVAGTLPMGDRLAGMFTAVQPGTGHVLAMSVNRVFGCTDPNDPACESVVLNDAASQGAGSTYKVFTAAAALEREFSQYYTLTTGDPYVSRVYQDEGRAYDVRNAGSYPQTLDLEAALYRSSNTYFLALEDALGSVEGPVRMAERMGMHFDQPNQTPAQQIIDEKRGSFTFGAEATSPLDLAIAYSTLAAGGTQCDATPVVQVLDRDGQPLLGTDGQPVVTGDTCTPEAIAPGVANTLNQMLRKDVEPGFGGTGNRAFVPGHQIAGKTGTSQRNFSAAFVGYTPEYAASVMVLDPKEGRDVGGYGGNKPAVIWNDAMTPILDAAPTAPFPPADPKVQNGNTTPVPRCAELVECATVMQRAGLRSVRTPVRSAEPPDTVLGTNPPAGTRAVPFQLVSIMVSDGADYVPPPPPVLPVPVPGPGVGAPPPDTNGDGLPG